MTRAHRQRAVGVGAGLVLAVLTPGCRRHLDTDELRARLRGAEADSTWVRFPCQALTVDQFGWTKYEVAGLAYRVSPTITRSRWMDAHTREHWGPGRRSHMVVRVTNNPPSLADFGVGLLPRRLESCSIGDRVAEVASGHRGDRLETRLVFADIGDGRSLDVTIQARTVAEGQVLRATLFTIEFP